jgi:hypothetical protein
MMRYLAAALYGGHDGGGLDDRMRVSAAGRPIRAPQTYRIVVVGYQPPQPFEILVEVQ